MIKIFITAFNSRDYTVIKPVVERKKTSPHARLDSSSSESNQSVV